MIIEIGLLIDSKSNEYLRQTYIFNKDQTVISEQNIPSYMDAFRVIDFANKIINLFAIHNPEFDVARGKLEPIYHTFDMYDYMSITLDSGRSITLTAIGQMMLNMKFSDNDTSYIVTNEGYVRFDGSASISLYSFICLMRAKEFIDILSTLVLIDYTENGGGNLYATTRAFKHISEYTDKYYNVRIVMNEKDNSLDFAGDVSGQNMDIVYEGAVATCNAIIFIDAYTSVEDFIAKEKPAEEDANELMKPEYEYFKDFVNDLVSNIRGNLSLGENNALPYATIVVNADPMTDEFYEPYDEDDNGGCIRLDNLEIDEDTKESIRNAVHNAIDYLFGDKEKPDDEDSSVIAIYEGYIDEDGNLHVQKPNPDDPTEIEDITI